MPPFRLPASLMGAVEYAGMDEKRDVLRLLRWLVLGRKKQKLKKIGGKY
ncbi:MAG: hypothetical protein ACTSU5_11040 [Promethearchaeota archaeon]